MVTSYTPGGYNPAEQVKKVINTSVSAVYILQYAAETCLVTESRAACQKLLSMTRQMKDAKKQKW